MGVKREGLLDLKSSANTDVMRKLHIFLCMKMGQEVQMKGGEGGSLGPQGVCAAQS